MPRPRYGVNKADREAAKIMRQERKQKRRAARVAGAAAALAKEWRIDATPEFGLWRSPDGQLIPHAWLRMGDVILHSRRYIGCAQAFEVEALPASAAFRRS